MDAISIFFFFTLVFYAFSSQIFSRNIDSSPFRWALRLVEHRCDGSWKKSGYRSNPLSFGLRVPASERWEWREGEGR